MKNTLNSIKCNSSTCTILHLNLNLPNVEKSALQNLIKDENLIIAKADKGDSVVLLPTTEYLKLAYEHLNDRKTYILLQKDPNLK